MSSIKGREKQSCLIILLSALKSNRFSIIILEHRKRKFKDYRDCDLSMTFVSRISFVALSMIFVSSAKHSGTYGSLCPVSVCSCVCLSIRESHFLGSHA